MGSGRIILIGAVLVFTACLGGGDQGAERLVTIHPRLFSSYVLATVQQAIVDFEPLREYACEPARNQVLLCQRAERVRQNLQTAQTQLTRLLGDAPERDQMPISPQSVPMSR